MLRGARRWSRALVARRVIDLMGEMHRSFSFERQPALCGARGCLLLAESFLRRFCKLLAPSITRDTRLPVCPREPSPLNSALSPFAPASAIIHNKSICNNGRPDASVSSNKDAHRLLARAINQMHILLERSVGKRAPCRVARRAKVLREVPYVLSAHCTASARRGSRLASGRANCLAHHRERQSAAAKCRVDDTSAHRASRLLGRE